MSPLTNALIHYWQRLPTESPAARRRCLESASERVSRGAEPYTALLPYALGDADDDIVAAATRAWLRTRAASTEGDGEAIDEAVEWVRRGLALNRGAVFGALLSLGDQATLARLPALRLVLSASEVETACRVLGPAPNERVVEFLVDWLALLADGPLACEQRSLATALQGWDCAQAA